MLKWSKHYKNNISQVLAFSVGLYGNKDIWVLINIRYNYN